jgi:hypothetical protein
MRKTNHDGKENDIMTSVTGSIIFRMSVGQLNEV